MKHQCLGMFVVMALSFAAAGQITVTAVMQESRWALTTGFADGTVIQESDNDLTQLREPAATSVTLERRTEGSASTLAYWTDNAILAEANSVANEVAGTLFGIRQVEEVEVFSETRLYFSVSESGVAMLAFDAALIDFDIDKWDEGRISIEMRDSADNLISRIIQSEPGLPEQNIIEFPMPAGDYMFTLRSFASGRTDQSSWSGARAFGNAALLFEVPAPAPVSLLLVAGASAARRRR